MRQIPLLSYIPVCLILKGTSTWVLSYPLPRISRAVLRGDNIGYHNSRTFHLSTSTPLEVGIEKDPITANENPIEYDDKKKLRPTVWTEFSALAAETRAINLGQGFPNWNPPDFVIQAGIMAISSGFNQYTRTAGHPRLVHLLAGRYTKHFKREVDPYTQIAITIGASQALYVTMQSLLQKGDEVILLEPFFDLYVGQIEMAGGTPVFVSMKIKDQEWKLDLDDLRAKITPNTRAILLNSPHNPTGKVFTLKEMEGIASLVRDNPRLMVISDEVYKYMVYDSGNGQSISPPSHVHFATLPDMWDRTVTISSAGKTFSVTGWQVGWVLGPQWLIQQIQAVLPYMQFCAATPLQEAMATILEKADQPYFEYPNYYAWLRIQYLRRRNRLEAALHAADIPTMQGQGGFFLIGDISHIPVPESYMTQGTPALLNMTKDWAFCRWLALEHGLIAIPTAPFFRSGGIKDDVYGKYVRFCFCKTDSTIDAAAVALQKMHISLR